jgi:hypothetical protein
MVFFLNPGISQSVSFIFSRKIMVFPRMIHALLVYNNPILLKKYNYKMKYSCLKLLRVFFFSTRQSYKVYISICGIFSLIILGNREN